MIFIYSHGGYAREFARCIRDKNASEELVFVDDNPKGGAIPYAEALRLSVEEQSSFVIGFADAQLRRQKTNQVKADGFKILSVTAQTAIVGDNVTVGQGAVLSDFSMITANAQIGNSFQCNIYSYIAHDCKVGDFVTLAPRVSVNGRVEICDDVYIGTGATILPGQSNRPITIGRGAIVGAHAMVVRDVPEHTTVVGVPAKELRKKD